MSKLDQVVFVIENDQIVESTIRDLSGYIDETTTPAGVAPRFHVRGTELWTWGKNGNNPRCVNKYDSAEEAEDALEDTFLYDFWNCSEILAFTVRADAEKFMKEGEC